MVSEEDAPPFTPVFEAVPEPEGSVPSPFVVVDEGDESSSQSFRPAKIPDKRKPQSPFQIVETGDPYSAMQGMPGYPYPGAYGMPPSPFAPAAHFGPFASPLPPQAYQPYVLHPYVNHPYAPQPAYAQPVYPPASAYPTGYPAYPPQENATPAAPAQAADTAQSPPPIRQLELRAIFGVNHEMGREEILQRSLGLAGIRNIAALSGPESSAIEALQSLLAKLGFPSDQLRVCAGQTPIEFVREGNTLLAVQTDEGFAPGVRETLMIVARELSRLV